MTKIATLKPRVQMLGASQRQGWADERRGSRHERGYGTAWDKLRRRILERDCSLCQPCRQAGRVTPARAVDHIVPKSQGGSDDEHNLQAICTPCHQAKTQRESNGQG